MIDFGIIWASLPLYLEGLQTTVWLVGVSLILGLMLAVPLGIMRASPNPLVSFPVWIYTYCFRGTPLLVQLFLIYYGSGQFEAIRSSFAWPLLQHAWFCALLSFVLNTAAYTAEIIRGAIVATPQGEIEAARACGMSAALRYRRIILPSAFRRALPAYGNEVILMLHGSAIASAVTIVDITGAADLVNARYYSPYEAFLTAAVFYLALSFVIVGAFRLLERHWYAHLRARPH
jgi:arginine/ornithine transport system permease protein